MLGIIVVVSMVIALSSKIFGDGDEARKAPQQVEKADEERGSRAE